MIEVNSQTDFVARDDNFASFVDQLLNQAVDTKATDVSAILTDDTEQKRTALVTKLGENINVRRLASLQAQQNQHIGVYVHTNKRIAAIALISGGDTALAKSVAMHIAASKPLVVNPADVDESVVAKEKEIYTQQALDSGKPAEIAEKMVVGRVKKFLAEVSLTEQNFVVEPDKTVGQLLKDAGATAQSFVLYTLGEGIEKEEVDFAQEVQASLNA